MKCKKLMTFSLAVILAVGALPYANVSEVHAEEQAQLPEAVYFWDFEDAGETEEALQGTARISEDSEKNSNVLDLAGTGAGTSYMTLPEDVFSDVTEGLTISMWVRPDASSGAYTKLFDASNSPLGETENGGNNWSSPDFALAAGGNVYDVTLYVGEAGQATKSKSKLKYKQSLTRNKWQYYTVSLSKDSFSVYVDGQKAEYQDAVDGTKAISEVLPEFFAEGYPQSLKYAALGRSFYTSDKDFIGKMDDVAIYNSALSDEQAAALYENMKFEYQEKEAAEIYKWDFENVDGKDAGNGAMLEGTAEITEDSAKLNGSKVLSLKGGKNGSSYMSLPEDILSKTGDKGFTLSMWVKASYDTGSYTRLFTASNSELGATQDGGNGWTSPDFALVTGGNVYDTTIYVGEAGKSTANATKIKYNTHLAKSAWQQLTVSVSPESYRVYINGAEVAYSDAQQGTKSVREVLPNLFDEGYLESLTYNALGRSVYGSDDDFEGLIDDVIIYEGTMGAEQAAALFAQYEGMDTTAPAGDLVVDMAQKTGEIKHGATGFLYGLGADNVPNVNLLTGLKPNINEQNAPHGLQHPSGDVLEVADTFLEAGGDSIQIACPDIHAEWPYEPESQDMQEYSKKIRKMVQDVKDAGLSDKVVYVPFNEPDGQRYNNDINKNGSKQFLQDWLTIYNVIKEEDPNAKVAGTNLTGYKAGHTETFMKFCKENNCIPDQFTWHVLNDGELSRFSKNVAQFREWEKKYWLDTGLADEECEIVINEYGNFTDTGVPGRLTAYLGAFEDEKASACLAYWHISNNLCDIAADNNEPNSTWWLYKWYGDMSGETLKMNVQGASKAELYGVAALDDNKKISTVILGGRDGDVNLTLQNVAGTEAFKDAQKIKVKLEQTNFTGINGVCDEPDLISEQICAVDDSGNVEVVIPDAQEAAAYHVTLSQAADDAEPGILTSGAWKQLFEAEDAQFAGNVREVAKDKKYPCSGRGQAQYIDNPGDSVTFTAEVPESGYYKFDMVYGAATGNKPNDTSNNNPKNAIQTLQVNGDEPVKMTLENTLYWFMSGMHTEYVYLNQGSNTLKVEATDSEGKATLDCMYLTYVGADETAVAARRNVKIFEAELSDFITLGEQSSTTVTTQNSISGYSGAGYVTGMNTPVSEGGGIRFNAFVFENGMYDVTARCYTAGGSTIGYYLDNTNLTLGNRATEAAVGGSDQWQDITVRMYLQKGMNIIDLDAADSELAVDTLTVSRNDDGTNTTIIEAESCALAGDAAIKENPFAAEGKYVSQMQGNSAGENSLTVTYHAEEAGTYKMAVYQSNKELFGNHSYNAQMVDRYATVSVNGGEPFNVFFRNTYSDDSFKSQVVTLDLQAGDNTIQFYNDDTRVLKNGVGGTNTCTNYTPNFDKFEITPIVENAEEEKKLTGITVTPPDKKEYLKGESLDLTGVIVTAYYGDGSSEIITEGYDISGYDPNKTGSQLIMVTYKGKTADFQVDVKEKVQSGWVQDTIGWKYKNADGSYVSHSWKQIDGKWYYFKETGYMATGWLQEGKTWYYLKANGAMATG
ncbi:hypothetical protein C3B58_00365, partial [Lactonifactor longoviformis]